MLLPLSSVKLSVADLVPMRELEAKKDGGLLPRIQGLVDDHFPVLEPETSQDVVDIQLGPGQPPGRPRRHRGAGPYRLRHHRAALQPCPPLDVADRHHAVLQALRGSTRRRPHG